MPQAGTYAALSDAYRDKPIDVAGAIAKTGEGIASSAVQAVKDENAELEKQRKEKERKDKENEKAFGDASSRIKVQDGAPPSAQQIAGIGGDEIYRIMKEMPPGLDRAAAIEGIINKSNRATQAITDAALSLESAPNDAFSQDGGFYNKAQNMLEGNFTYEWRDGEMYVVGIGKDGEKLNMTIDEYSAALTPPDGLQQIDIAAGSEQLINIKKSKGYNLNTQAGQDAIRTDGLALAQSTLNLENGGAASRFIYNNFESFADVEGFDANDKAALLDIGKALQGGASVNDLSEEEVALLNKYIPQAQQLAANAMVGTLPKINEQTGTTRITNTNNSGANDNSDYNPRLYIKNTTKTLDAAQARGYSVNVNEIDAELAKLEGDGFDENSTVTLGAGTDNELTIEFSDEGNLPPFETESKGTLTITTKDGQGNATLEFDNDTPGQTMRDVVLNHLYGDDLELVKQFTPQTIKVGGTEVSAPSNELVSGGNMGNIAQQLSVFYRSDAYDFQPIQGGVSVVVGDKTYKIPLEGVSEDQRAAKIAQYIQLANK